VRTRFKHPDAMSCYRNTIYMYVHEVNYSALGKQYKNEVKMLIFYK